VAITPLQFSQNLGKALRVPFHLFKLAFDPLPALFAKNMRSESGPKNPKGGFLWEEIQ
jgi:hypothetical protein